MKTNQTTSPTHKEVGVNFYQDSCDLCERFEYCWIAESPAFDAIKSKRFKLFIDLRIALESTLKAIVSFKKLSNYSGKTLIKEIRKYSHHIDKLTNDSIEFTPEENQIWLNQISHECKNLPISLRYKLDADDFRFTENSFYYRTIGSDRWMQNFLNNVQSLNNFISSNFFEKPRILSGKELRDIVKQPRYNTYRKAKE